jgi:uncharacterized membrane protein
MKNLNKDEDVNNASISFRYEVLRNSTVKLVEIFYLTPPLCTTSYVTLHGLLSLHLSYRSVPIHDKRERGGI